MPRGFQTAHGFTSGQVIRRNFSGGVWELAQSDTLSAVRGVINEVIDANTFNFEHEGNIRLAGHGFTVGETYYISPTVAGEVVTPQPATGQQDPIFFVPDSGNLLVFATRGGATTYRQAFVNGDLTANVLTVDHNLNKRYVHVQIYADNEQLKANSLYTITTVTVDQLTIDIGGPITGTWNLIVSA